MGYLERLFGLSGKTALVTGAAGQLGTRFSLALAECGVNVVAWDIADNYNSAENNNLSIVDIRDSEQVALHMQTIFEQEGGLDILINNAGASVFEPFEERSEQSFDIVMDVNLKGTFNCIHQYVRCYDTVGQSHGSVINISSHYGLVSPDPRIYTDCNRRNSEVYGATKAGVIQMTKYFAVHLADRGIRVNAISPGGIYNPAAPQGEDFQRNYAFRCPMQRMGRDDELAGAILYLSGNAATYTNGANIVIDGGTTSW